VPCFTGGMDAPPDPLVSSLLDGPSPVTSFEWHAEIDSTNRRAADLAAAGTPEIAVVAADVQTAGRGRAGRAWTAPAGSSLMLSLVLRPPVAASALPLLPLLAGMALAETAERFVPGAEVALKWPNDLLVRADPEEPWRKAAGILAEAVPGGAVVGMGTNVDWWGVERPAELRRTATSLAEAAGHAVDRWRVMAALLGVFGNRYDAWCALPAAFLDGYRSRCTTIGREISAQRPGGEVLTGTAVDVAASGALVVRTPEGRRVEVGAGDVSHVRPA
jgi:BirA family transcriptional regulator, biotin operon repressor / biotin---[acetyl-CoA-carboxylase] ligase